MRMDIFSARVKRAARLLPAALLAAGLAACGGGSGNSSSATAPTPTGGADTPVVSVGTITGFGSIHVNGVKFETTAASITVDDAVATQDDLKVGYFVKLRGYRDHRSGRHHADRVDFRHNVRGPIESISTDEANDTETLVVLGQTVLITADTSLDETITVDTPLVVGDIVEVSGMVATDGSIQATRVEREPAGTPYMVFGTVSATDPGAGTLMINALTVDYSAATLKGFPATGPADGDLVVARGTELGAEGQLLATRLANVTDYMQGHDHDEAELEGLITGFVSLTEAFNVAGQPVMVSDSTAYYGGTAADLADDVRVEAEGAFDEAGVLLASKIRIFRKSASLTRLVGPVDEVTPDSEDPTIGTITILGIAVEVTDMTRLEDRGFRHVKTFSLADLSPGDWLAVRGGESPADSNMLVATRLERTRPQQSVGLAGIVKAADTPPVSANAGFTILSVDIMTTDSTRLTDRRRRTLTPDEFFTDLVGQRVGVRGTWDAGASLLTAQQATLAGGDWEDHD